MCVSILAINSHILTCVCVCVHVVPAQKTSVLLPSPLQSCPPAQLSSRPAVKRQSACCYSTSTLYLDLCMANMKNILVYMMHNIKYTHVHKYPDIITHRILTELFVRSHNSSLFGPVDKHFWIWDHNTY